MGKVLVQKARFDIGFLTIYNSVVITVKSVSGRRDKDAL